MNTKTTEPAAAPAASQDFLRAIVADDLREGRYDRIVTRFPPEPNGYLHIGHAKSIVLNFGIAAETGGECHLRFDDTNPETEEAHYVQAIRDAVAWLGFDWGEHLYFASDYFGKMYEFAEHLVRQGRAYVDSLDAEQMREYRGTVMEPGRESPYRSRSVDENLDLLRRMRAGEFPDGAHVLRAKMDMTSRNMLLRDPVLYRIRHATHYRTGDDWCIYPLYDFAHPIEDALECVTHSLCTLEFENNRPIYDWVVENIPVSCRPHQYEFARLNLDFTVMSKRKLLELVKGGFVDGWDDPRMPTIAGLRRRGFTPESIRAFCEMIGVARTANRIDIGKLEFAVRDDLNQKAPRVFCVPRPLRVVITNYPAGKTEELEAPYYPHDVPKTGSRKVPFSRVVYIDRDDFREDPPKGYHRLTPGAEVRLRYAYIIRCDEVVKDASGEVVELRCSYDPTTRSGGPAASRAVKGTIQWVSAEHGVSCKLRLYDRLFSVADPEAGEEEDFKTHLNPESLVVVENAVIEPGVRDDPAGSHYQFERVGYFLSDPEDSRPDRLVFNRTVTLRDTWAKLARGTEPAPAPPVATRGSEPGRKPPVAPPRPAPVGPRAPELEVQRARFARQHAVSAEEADLLTRDAATADLFEQAAAGAASAKGIANWLIHELPRELEGRAVAELAFGGRELGELVALVEDGTLSSSTGREVLAEMARSGGSPADIVERRGLRQISDVATLAPLVDQVIATHEAKVTEFRDGKVGLLGFFVGQVMRASGGRANPELVKELLTRRLRNGTIP